MRHKWLACRCKADFITYDDIVVADTREAPEGLRYALKLCTRPAAGESRHAPMAARSHANRPSAYWLAYIHDRANNRRLGSRQEQENPALVDYGISDLDFF